MCFQFTHFLCDDWENIYTLSYHHHQIEVWTITRCLGLGHETMVCAVCLSIFLWVNVRPAYLRDRQRKWRHYNVSSKSTDFTVSWEDEYTSCNIRSCYGKIWHRKRQWIYITYICFYNDVTWTSQITNNLIIFKLSGLVDKDSIECTWRAFCEGNPSVIGGFTLWNPSVVDRFPSQRVSDEENGYV